MIAPGLFRLCLASVVVVTHFSRLELGAAAVDLFFVLSGFWIYRMFSDKYKRASRPGMLFFASRILRLLPVFLLFNCLALALHLMIGDEVASSQTLIGIIPNILIIGYASLPMEPLRPAWSLDMELQFYIVFPLLFAFIGTWAKHTIAILVVSLGLGGLYTAFFIDSFTGSATLLPYGGFFILGVLAARRQWRPSLRLAYGSGMLLALAALVVLAIPSLRGFVVHSQNDVEFTWNSSVNFMVALVATPVALASVYVKSNSRDRIIGDLSYVVYCSHWLGVIIATRYLREVELVYKAVAVGVLIALIYSASFLVLIYLDRPISRWREAWVTRNLSSQT